jgi:hypothetical protein
LGFEIIVSWRQLRRQWSKVLTRGVGRSSSHRFEPVSRCTDDDVAEHGSSRGEVSMRQAGGGLTAEVVPGFVELEVAVPHLSPAVR